MVEVILEYQIRLNSDQIRLKSDQIRLESDQNRLKSDQSDWNQICEQSELHLTLREQMLASR